MLRVSWLSGLHGRLVSSYRVKLRGRMTRRNVWVGVPQSAELLEERLVMTGPPIDLTTATSDVAAADSALAYAQVSFVALMSGLQNTLISDFATHASTANGAIDSAEGAFDSAIDGINTSLAGVVAGLTNSVQAQVATRAGTLHSSITGINNSFNKQQL